MSSRIGGVDINGLWDWGATWSDEDEEPIVRDAGKNGSVVRLDCDQRVMIAGNQASLAPHGRGPGWGRLGGDQYRVWIQDLLDHIVSDDLEQGEGEALGALLQELMRDARLAFLAVPDVAAFGEDARERLLHLCNRVGLPGVSLLWRPIAAILAWLSSSNEQATGPIHHARVAVLSLLRHESQLAEALLVREEWAGRALWVPERRQGGFALPPSFGCGELARGYAEAVAAPLALSGNQVLRTTMAPWRYAVGDSPGRELVRLANRSWRALPQLSADPQSVSIDDAGDDACWLLAQADIILVEGPAAANIRWRSLVLQALRVRADDRRLVCLSPEATARGCLEAGLRRSRREPVYFDFLPQLEVNALVGDAPEFVELIPAGARVEGGERYSGKAAAKFALSAGANELTFYLIKGDYHHPRKATVPLATKPETNHSIDVTVEQQPGQGYARVRIVSDSYEPFRLQPLELDWRAMEDVNKDRETLLAELSEYTRAAYPDVSVIPGHAIHWHPDHRFGDIRAILQAYLDHEFFSDRYPSAEALAALQALRDRVRRASSPRYDAQVLGLVIEEESSARPLDTQGRLPEPLPGLPIPTDVAVLLDAALDKVTAEFDEFVETYGTSADRTILGHFAGFATWCFWRCPNRFVRHLLEVYSGRRDLDVHPTLLIEGLGRSVREPVDIDRFIESVDERLRDGGKLRNSEYAALGRILGGNEIAAERLSPEAARRILKAACGLIEEENNEAFATAYKRKFKSALLMLAVLLRVRRSDPQFLMPDRGSVSESLLSLLETAIERCNRFAVQADRRATGARGKRAQALRNDARRFRGNVEIAEELVRFIHLEGSDPNIIRKIEEMSAD